LLLLLLLLFLNSRKNDGRKKLRKYEKLDSLNLWAVKNKTVMEQNRIETTKKNRNHHQKA